MYAVGIIHLALLERYREDVSQTAWTGALQSALISVGGLFTIVFSFLFSRFADGKQFCINFRDVDNVKW